jgi:hypothetical protein
MVLTDKYVFYTLSTPESENRNKEPGADDGPRYMGELHRVDLNGENDVNLGISVTTLDTYKNTVYYSDSRDYYFYSINPETLEKAIIYKGYFITDTCFGGNYVFFETDHMLYKLSLVDWSTTLLKKAFGFSLDGIFDEYLYFTVYGEYAFYKMSIDSVTPEKLGDIHFGN